MAATAEIALANLPDPDCKRLADAREQNKRATEQTAKRQGSIIQEIAFESILRLRDSQENEEDAATARAHAQAVSALGKLWREARQQVRIEQGKPDPGNLKPVAKERTAKTRPRVLAKLPAMPGDGPA